MQMRQTMWSWDCRRKNEEQMQRYRESKWRTFQQNQLQRSRIWEFGKYWISENWCRRSNYLRFFTRVQQIQNYMMNSKLLHLCRKELTLAWANQTANHLGPKGCTLAPGRTKARCPLLGQMPPQLCTFCLLRWGSCRSCRSRTWWACFRLGGMGRWRWRPVWGRRPSWSLQLGQCSSHQSSTRAVLSTTWAPSQGSLSSLSDSRHCRQSRHTWPWPCHFEAGLGTWPTLTCQYRLDCVVEDLTFSSSSPNWFRL